MPDAPALLVTAAIMRREARVLIARRKPGTGTLAGLWEFPGGKVDPGEAPEAAMVRELHEEFGIAAECGPLLCRTRHVYPRGPVELLAFEVRHLSGAMELRDHDAIEWVLPDALSAYALVPADVAIARRLQGAGRGPADRPSP